MKIILGFLIIVLVTAQIPAAEYNKIVLPIKLANDSLEVKYYEEIKKTDKLTDRLIAKTKRLEEKNLLLLAENKQLKKANAFLRNNINTVYVTDTIFKKRRILQIFKKKKNGN